MKLHKSVLLPAIIIIIFSSCSSIPKGERLVAVNTRKEQAALFLSRGHNEYGWNNYDSSIKLYTNAFSISSSVDWQEGMVRSLVHLSRSADRITDAELSLSYLDAAEELLAQTDGEILKVLVGNRETEWLLFHESPEKALEKCTQVIEFTGSLDSEEAGETLRLKASIHKKMKSYEDALAAIDKAITLDNKQHYIAELASDYYIKASILSLSSREEDGINSMLQALHYDKFIENTPAIAQDLFALALIYEKTGNTEKSNHYYQRTYLVYAGAGRQDIPSALRNKLKNSSNSVLLFQETDVF